MFAAVNARLHRLTTAIVVFFPILQFNYMGRYAGDKVIGGFMVRVGVLGNYLSREVYGWNDLVLNRHFLVYAISISLQAGERVRLEAGFYGTALYQEFSGYYLGPVDYTRPPTQPPTGTAMPTPSPTQACVAPAPAAPPIIGFSILSPVTASTIVSPGDNAFSGYAAGSPIIEYDVIAGLTGGWNNTGFEYVAPSTGYVSSQKETGQGVSSQTANELGADTRHILMLRRVYHFNYVARFQDTAGRAGVQGQQHNGSTWAATFGQPLYAWSDGEADRRFLAWSTEIFMASGDKFRIVNSLDGVDEEFIFQQLSGYFVGTAPLGAQVTLSAHSFLAGSNMFLGPVTHINFENIGGCSAAGFSSAGYIAPRSGLYQLQVRKTSNHVFQAEVVYMPINYVATVVLSCYLPSVSLPLYLSIRSSVCRALQ